MCAVKTVLLCLPGASGTAECFYRIMDGLCPKGYRVVAAQHPPYYTINEFVIGMDAFLDSLEVHRATPRRDSSALPAARCLPCVLLQAPSVHILGASLGGLLAQQYAIARPSRVSSIMLCNSFYSTTSFIPTAGSMVTSMYAVAPYFVLKNMLLSSFNNDAAAIAASVRRARCTAPAPAHIRTFAHSHKSCMGTHARRVRARYHADS